MATGESIDVLENHLRKHGKLLDILLHDFTTGKNIIWATDSYRPRGRSYAAKEQILPELVTGNRGKLIQPRAAKSREEQRQRTKDKGEVFTPLRIVEQMNTLIERSGTRVNKSNWQEFVKEPKLEISCGEAPFIVSRYNPTSHTGKLIKLENRVGFLDRKLSVVSTYCDTSNEWIKWAQEAYRASYGYEWQGDNLLIARENLLYTLRDYYMAKFDETLPLKVQEEFAEIISWNIFQMDGLKYVVPKTCKHETKIVLGELTLFGATPDRVEKNECEGCKFSKATKHNGKYVKIMDWEAGKTVRFVDILHRRSASNV